MLTMPIDCFSFLTSLVCFRISSTLGVESLDFSRAHFGAQSISLLYENLRQLSSVTSGSQLKLKEVIDFLIELGGSLLIAQLFLYRNNNNNN